MADSYVCSKAKIKCSCGDKISTLTVYPDRTIWLTGEPQANISDHISMRNIAPFGKCHTTRYPATGSATAANHGKLTPMPCVPNTPFSWMGGKDDVVLKGQPALLKSSTCKCIWGGTISFVKDGQIDGTYQELTQEQSLSQDELNQKAEVELTPEELLDGLQMALDVAGMFPGLGAIPDLLNACISACRGNWGDAGLSLFAAIPGIGDAAGAAKLMKNGAKIAKTAKKIGKVTSKLDGDVATIAYKETRLTHDKIIEKGKENGKVLKFEKRVEYKATGTNGELVEVKTLTHSTKIETIKASSENDGLSISKGRSSRDSGFNQQYFNRRQNQGGGSGSQQHGTGGGSSGSNNVFDNDKLGENDNVIKMDTYKENKKSLEEKIEKETKRYKDMKNIIDKGNPEGGLNFNA